ncbi:ABC-type transport auxiliary lipoprotein family protein [Luteimonas lutimaris]|uniref:ABC-type transport auxiliary lipoprotein component domain-containing protein n=1 Tax=Luteimonas lutimaris TaxID=698645 RepID=A0ABP7MWA3_9GAMM
MQPPMTGRTRQSAHARASLAPQARAAVLALVCGLLAGCSLLGGGNQRESSTIYAPDPRVAPDPAWPSADWQLTISPASAARMIDSLRIAVRPVPAEVQVYKGASWSKPPTQMLEDSILRTLEDSGKLRAVARQGRGIEGDYRLVMDLRRFEAEYAGAAVPSATIEVSAKLLHPVDRQAVASRTFLVAEPAVGTAVPEVVSAFDTALAEASRQIAGWVLASGAQHEQQPH